MKLRSKVAIVTGAGRGIGREIALSLAQEGAKVVVNDVDIRSIDSVVREIKKMGGGVLGFRADISRSQEVHRMVQESLEYYEKIDILVNNAGIMSVASIFDLQERDWDKVFSVNVKGVFLCSRFVIEHMVKRKTGKIVNISSIAGKTGEPNLASYCASKFAVIGLTQVMARELAPYKINVNAVCPGFIDTVMFDAFEEKKAQYLDINKEDIQKGHIEESGWGRRGAPRDVASLVIFLVSAEADYITGQAINVCAAGEFH